MRALLILSAAVVVFFLFLPRADLAVSQLFYTPGQGFTLEWHKLLRGAYLGVRYLAGISVGLLVLTALFMLAGKKIIRGRSWCYLALVLIVGPLLIVEVVCKDNLPRPRPREVVEFGGALDYVPPLSIGTQGGKSFASTHTAIGFCFVAFAFLQYGRKRRYLYIAGITFGSLIGLVRIMQGGHFLSDVVFSALIMLWTIHLLAWIMRLDSPSKE